MSQMLNAPLRKARRRSFLSIRQAAELIGVSPVTYMRWEQGTQVPHLTSLQMLCEAFNARPDELGFSPLLDEH